MIRFFELLKNKRNIFILIFSIAFLILGIRVFDIFGKYAEAIKQPGLFDYFHNILPLVNLNWLVTGGFFLILVLLALYVIIFEPRRSAFVLFLGGGWLILRSLLFSMTILGAPSIRIDDTPMFRFDGLYTSQDLFPSGHIAMAFIAFLLFNDNGSRFSKVFRWTMLALSIIMGVGVLLMHVHYSVDVFGGYFVVFGFYYFCRKYLYKYLELN
jgi:membrane-associated phospholipid phosphatase